MHVTRGTRSLLPMALALVGVLVAGCSEADGPTQLAPASVEAGHGGSHGGSHAEQRNFRAHLTGAEEVPPVETKAQGQAIFQLSKDGTEISYRLIVANIENVAQAHIHVGFAGQNGGVVAWLYPEGPPAQPIPGRTQGVLAEGVITVDDLVGPYAGEPLETLIAAMRVQGVYVNVHTQQNPPGEIRGQIR
jgi:hypothetical protein